VYASTSTVLSKLADVATGNALISGGVGVAPSYGKIGLTTHVSGTLPVANGGTNASSAGITAFNNITGYTASGATGTTSTNLVFSASPTFTGTPAAPTASAKTATTQLATTAFVDVLRSLSAPTTGTSGTLVVGDRGALVAATGGITVPNSVFAANDVVTIANNSSSSITITQGSGVTMYLVGTATTGNRTLAQRGVATVVFISASVAIISGGGLS